jgi:hypothetical protein
VLHWISRPARLDDRAVRRESRHGIRALRQSLERFRALHAEASALDEMPRRAVARVFRAEVLMALGAAP